MPLTKEKKQKIIEELKEKIDRQKIIIFIDFTGMKVKDLSNLRKNLKITESELKVVKKTLSKIAFFAKGLEVDIKKIPGELALVFGYKEEILPTKVLYQFSLENPNLKILGGYLENKLISAKKIIELAQLPTKEELLVKLIRSISAPISNFLNVLDGNLRRLVYVLSTIKKSNQVT